MLPINAQPDKTKNRPKVSATITLTNRILVSILQTSLLTAIIVCCALATKQIQAESNVIVKKPSKGVATLSNQPLNFECGVIKEDGDGQAQFKWYKKPVDSTQDPIELDITNETYEVHNEKLTIYNKDPSSALIGDYICKLIKSDDWKDSATIKLRQAPQLDEFEVFAESHTDYSAIVREGNHFEALCKAKSTSVPLNVTWFKSLTPNDNQNLIPLTEAKPDSNSGQVSTAQPVFPSNAATNGLAPPVFEAVHEPNVFIYSQGKFSKKLVIMTVRPEDRSYYVCLASDGVTDPARRVIYLRVQDPLAWVWPLLGIIALLVILFAIIYIWNTNRANKETEPGHKNTVAPTSSSSQRRKANDKSPTAESEPLNSQ